MRQERFRDLRARFYGYLYTLASSSTLFSKPGLLFAKYAVTQKPAAKRSTANWSISPSPINGRQWCGQSCPAATISLSVDHTTASARAYKLPNSKPLLSCSLLLYGKKATLAAGNGTRLGGVATCDPIRLIERRHFFHVHYPDSISVVRGADIWMMK